ncbi:MAG: type I glutamate--ammonia ligase [Dehalococcoidia bacterium]|nr:type I glutamate--ammonia ligase [Dehalococcoidia bacterium]
MTTKSNAELKAHVIKQCKDRDVRFIRIWFTDVLGFLKSFTISVSELENALEDGIGFDGSSIEGFTRIDESDMVAMPDPETFRLLPWRPTEHHATARMFCDVQLPGGQPFEGDPRFALKKVLKRAAGMGYTFYVGPELEYFYFKKNGDGKPHSTEFLDAGGYFDLTPLDEASDLRRDTVLTLEEMGILVEYSHHEGAPSQHEIDMRYTEALTMADQVMTYRLVVKEVAHAHGVYATFMPKPVFGVNGSGMHVHQSLFRGARNAFFDAKDPYHLSKEARSYVAGLLAHAAEITAITSQWINSYKRLVPGYEAPVYISWAQRNRSDLVRVPQYKPGHEKATRVEYRSPDPACNPYLCFAVMLTAGLDGIEKGMVPPDPIEGNVYEMGTAERAARGIGTLPASLLEAVELAEKSDIVKRALGEHIFNAFIENKKQEWDQFRMQVTQYELDKYLPIL